jgi:hypothetical protein
MAFDNDDHGKFTNEMYISDINPYAPLASVADDRQLIPDETTARTYSVLFVWLAAWLTTAIAGGVFGFGMLAIGGGVLFGIVGFGVGIIIAGIVAAPVSTLLYVFIALITRTLTSNTAMASAGVCGGISGVISSLAMGGGSTLGLVIAAGLVGAIIPATLVKMFLR